MEDGIQEKLFDIYELTRDVSIIFINSYRDYDKADDIEKLFSDSYKNLEEIEKTIKENYNEIIKIDENIMPKFSNYLNQFKEVKSEVNEIIENKSYSKEVLNLFKDNFETLADNFAKEFELNLKINWNDIKPKKKRNRIFSSIKNLFKKIF